MTISDPAILAQEFGTPLLVFSLPKFKQQLDHLAAAWSSWPGCAPMFYLPTKANNLLPFIRMAVLHGLGLDVTEANEIDVSVHRVGAVPTKIVVSGPAKDQQLLQRAVDCRARIHVDSLDELQALQKIASDVRRNVEMGFRLRLDETSKFGFLPTDAEWKTALELVCKSPWLSLVALHHHDSNSLNSIEAIRQTLISLCKIRGQVVEMTGNKRTIEMNLGGGVRIAEDGAAFSDYEEFALSFKNAARETNALEWQFAFEWGRALLSPCGSVIARVVRCKQSSGRTWLYLNVGQNVVGGGHAGLSHHPVQLASKTQSDCQLLPTTIAGPLCFRSDVIAEVPFPQAHRNDLILIGNTGAYTINTRWHGPGKSPVVLMETEAGIEYAGRLPHICANDHDIPGALDDLFRLFFRDEFKLVTENSVIGIACGISSGTNNLEAPSSLKSLLEQEISSGAVVRAYTGPYGSDEIAVAALAFEEAFAGNIRINRNRCAVTIGAAQGIAVVMRFLKQHGYDHCIIAGPQYPLVHDIVRREGFDVTELLGHFAAGCLPSADFVNDALRRLSRSVLFITIPNNPTGTSPSEQWLRIAFKAVYETGGHVLIDRSSEDLPLLPWVQVPSSTSLASDLLPPNAYSIVNSSSKSRSVPGVRLGYLLGSEEMAKAVADFNYSEFLSVPRCGTTFVAADMVLRALWWREVRHGESPADALHHVLDTVCRQDGPGLTTTDVDVFYSLRASYLRECEINLAIIKDAQRQFAKELGELWLAATPHHNGFNVIAEIATGQDGRSFAAGLFRATGLRLLPSECFTFDGVPVVTPHGALAFRLSSAEDPARLRAAAQVLSRHIREVSH